MIKLDRNYSDYTDMTDSNYPNGKAMDCSTDESYDGTPILQSLVNDVKGALESVVYQAEGSLNKVSGNPDNIAASDFLNALKKLINTPDAAHAGLRGTDAHGATTSATAGQLMARDTNGRCQVSAPSADADISTKKYVDDTASTAESNAKNLANATGTLAVAHGGTGNTSVDTAPTANSTKMCTSGGIQSAISTAESNAKNLANATGTLAIAHGGTGATTANNAWNALAGSASSATGEFTDNTEFITSNANGYSDTDKTFYRRKASLMKSWIRGLFTNGTGTSYNSTTGAFSVSYGNTANTACQGNDSRLSNSRTPTSHASTGTSYGVSSNTNYGHAMATSTTPKANSGTGNVGTETAKFARGDHVHPETYSVPIGFTYFQLPGEKAPSELFPNTYTWLDITAHFEGLFFRAAGGNAKAFDTCNYEVQTTNATTVTLKKTPTGLAVGDTVICYNTGDESKTKTRKIKAISSSTITFEDSISSASYTNVLIAQGDTNKSHSHGITDPGHNHSHPLSDTDGGSKTFVKSAADYWHRTGYTQTSKTGISINSEGDTEARPVNTSIRIWKRTA